MTGDSLKNRCILVVDDNANARKLAVDSLSNEGYRVIEAESSGCAMERAQSHSVDAFLIHLDMAGRNGIEICRDIRNIEPYKITPIILFARHGGHDETVAAFESGCTDVLDAHSMNSAALRTRLKD